MTSGGNCARVWLLRFPVQVGKLTQSQLSQSEWEARYCSCLSSEYEAGSSELGLVLETGTGDTAP